MESEAAMQTENRRDPKLLLNKQDSSSDTVIMLKLENDSFLIKEIIYVFTGKMYMWLQTHMPASLRRKH